MRREWVEIDPRQIPHPNSDWQPRARHCQSCNASTTRQCGKCRRVFYCSPYCQRRDWLLHKLMCPLLQDQLPHVVNLPKFDDMVDAIAPCCENAEDEDPTEFLVYLSIVYGRALHDMMSRRWLTSSLQNCFLTATRFLLQCNHGFRSNLETYAEARFKPENVQLLLEFHVPRTLDSYDPYGLVRYVLCRFHHPHDLIWIFEQCPMLYESAYFARFWDNISSDLIGIAHPKELLRILIQLGEPPCRTYPWMQKAIADGREDLRNRPDRLRQKRLLVQTAIRTSSVRTLDLVFLFAPETIRF